MATNNTDQKYLSLAGLSTFWGKVKDYIDTADRNIKVSFGTNGNLTKFTVDNAGRVISVDETALVTRLNDIDGDKGSIAALDARLTAIDKENGELDVLQAAVAKLNGEGEGSVKAQVAAAEAAAKKYTNDLETELRGGNADDSLQTLRADINTLSGNGTGSVADQIDAKINTLDVTDAAVTGEYVSAVSETDGKISVSRAKLPTYEIVDNADFITVTPTTLDNGGKSFTITTSDIASASALSTLTQDVRKLDTATTGRVSVLETKVDALSSATHFIGVKDELPATAAAGDVVIVGEKEYIYSEGAWVELGDTTAEKSRLSALETTVGAAAHDGKPATGLVAKVDALETAVGGNTVVNTFGGQSGAITVDTTAEGEGNVKFSIGSNKKLTATVNIGATAAQGTKADTAIQTVTGVNGTHTTTTVSKEDPNSTELKIKVDVATVGADKYTDTTSTAIPTAGSVMSKINAAISALTANDEVETNVIGSIVTGVSQAGGKITVTKSSFNAITDEEIGKLF